MRLTIVIVAAIFLAACGGPKIVRDGNVTAVSGASSVIVDKPAETRQIPMNCKKLADGSEICRPVHAATPAEEGCYAKYPTDPEARRFCIAASQERNNREAQGAGSGGSGKTDRNQSAYYPPGATFQSTACPTISWSPDARRLLGC